MPNIGPMELIIVLVIVLIFVGPKKLPGLGKSLGTGMREFKDSVSGSDKDEALTAQAHKVEDVATPPPAPTPLPAPTPDPLKKPAAPAAEHAEPAPQPRDAD